MDTLITGLQQATQAVTPGGVVLCLLLAFGMSLAIAYTYRATQSGGDYSTSFFQTLIIVCMVVSLLIMIIGSDLARAFALVGALSIIRFRNAVRSSRDLAFLFLAIGVGMACGTRFYIAALLGTVFICVMIYGLRRFDVGRRVVRDKVFKVQMPRDAARTETLKEVFDQHLESYKLVGLETVRQGAAVEMVYTVRMKPGAQELGLLQGVRAVSGNEKAVLLTGQQLVDL